MTKQKNSTTKIGFCDINNITFHEVFEGLDYDFILVEDQAELSKYKSTKSCCTWELRLLPTELETLPNRFSPLQEALNNNPKSITYEYHRIPKNIVNDILKYVNKIKLNQKLVEQVENFYTSNFQPNQKVIGVTVRTWPEHLVRRKWYHINHYIKKLDILIKKYPQAKIFVCSDADEPIKQLKQKYGTKVVTNDLVKRVRGGTYNLNINDIVDLMILMKANVVVGCLTSNWAELVWYFSGCQIEVATVNEIYNDKCLQLVKKGKLKNYHFIT